MRLRDILASLLRPFGFLEEECDHVFFPVEGAERGTYIGQRCVLCDHFNPIKDDTDAR